MQKFSRVQTAESISRRSESNFAHIDSTNVIYNSLWYLFICVICTHYTVTITQKYRYLRMVHIYKLVNPNNKYIFNKIIECDSFVKNIQNPSL